MVDHLKMPDAAAGAGIESQKAIGEKIIAVAVGAIKVVLGARCGCVNHAVLLVQCEFTPDVGSADRSPRVLGAAAAACASTNSACGWAPGRGSAPGASRPPKTSSWRTSCPARCMKCNAVPP